MGSVISINLLCSFILITLRHGVLPEIICHTFTYKIMLFVKSKTYRETDILMLWNMFVGYLWRVKLRLFVMVDDTTKYSKSSLTKLAQLFRKRKYFKDIQKSEGKIFLLLLLLPFFFFFCILFVFSNLAIPRQIFFPKIYSLLLFSYFFLPFISILFLF